MAFLRFVLVVVLAFGGGSTVFAEGPKISPTYNLVQARKIALARVPGTVVHEKLKLKKKKNPVYSIKIQPRSGSLTKVEIDGVTGLVLKVKVVTPKVKPDTQDSDD